MGNSIEVFFVIFAMSLWFLFPIGIFVAMNNIDRYGKDMVRLGHREEDKVHLPAKAIKKASTAWYPHWPAFIQRLRHH